MRSVQRSRILSVLLCLFVLAALGLSACGGGTPPTVSLSITVPTLTPTTAGTFATTDLTQVSVPEIPEWMQVEVPDVVGMHIDDAWDAFQAVYLNSHGAWTDPNPNSYQWFHIVAQDPEPGTMVPMFTSVEITIVEPAYVMPDVVGMPEMDAGWLVDIIGFTQDHVYVETSDSADWGIVIAQDPAPGALWTHSPPVTLDVGVSSTTTSIAPRISPTTTPPTFPKIKPIPLTLPTTTTTTLPPVL